MNRRLTLLTLAVSFALSSTFAVAADSAVKQTAKPPQPASLQPETAAFPAKLVSVLPPGGTVVKSFKAEAGLTGWVIGMPNGEKMIGYTVSSGDYLFVGALVNAKGDNLTAQYTDREVPKTPVPAFESLSSLPYIQQGNGKGKLVYMFSDPYCGYCHLQEQLAELYETNGDLNIRWITVAVLSPNSGALAEALSKAPNPAAAWKALSKKAPGAVSVTKPDMSPEYTIQSKAATQAMKAFGGNGTPHIVWQDDAGVTQTRAGLVGVVSLAEILKVPVATNVSPELAKFR